ncbi:hypothetical protein PAXRUDRAFT_29193 [Paxillus rubicundulus Ve08.2h10]|uniref:Uncharacterized protein n=1 Tax=Paxillus rubicundulus Ve08.2h10 TaxID=930991 RepID=A0A0D0CFA8_9AGAM|nr:hypothetical protein PAXRUDRAFT_29193 [Paxillus rubicundulus Ve08.2h10]
MDSTFQASGKAVLTNANCQKLKELRGGILSAINEENKIISWVHSAVKAVFPDTNAYLNVWHFIARHAENGKGAEYWNRSEQEQKLTSAFEKWAKKGTVWSAAVQKVHQEQLKHV